MNKIYFKNLQNKFYSLIIIIFGSIVIIMGLIITKIVLIFETYRSDRYIWGKSETIKWSSGNHLSTIQPIFEMS